jgi:hypothetical protein
MSATPPNSLEEKLYVTAILRLLLDNRGEIVHGEVADVQGRPSKRFVDWEGLVPAVRAWLASLVLGNSKSDGLNA